MDYRTGIDIKPRDRVLRSWENSTEMVRDYQFYAHEFPENKELSELFYKYAEDEGVHAAELLKILHQMEKE